MQKQVRILRPLDIPCTHDGSPDSDEGDALMFDDDGEDDEVEVQSVPSSFLFRLLHEARSSHRPLRKMPSFTKPHEEPQEAGVHLLIGGEFGRVRVKQDMRSQKHNVARQLLSRRTRLRPSPKEDITSVRMPTGNSVSSG